MFFDRRFQLLSLNYAQHNIGLCGAMTLKTNAGVGVDTGHYHSLFEPY